MLLGAIVLWGLLDSPKASLDTVFRTFFFGLKRYQLLKVPLEGILHRYPSIPKEYVFIEHGIPKSNGSSPFQSVFH